MTLAILEQPVSNLSVRFARLLSRQVLLIEGVRGGTTNHHLELLGCSLFFQYV